MTRSDENQLELDYHVVRRVDQGNQKFSGLPPLDMRESSLKNDPDNAHGRANGTNRVLDLPGKNLD